MRWRVLLSLPERHHYISAWCAKSLQVHTASRLLSRNKKQRFGDTIDPCATEFGDGSAFALFDKAKTHRILVDGSRGKGCGRLQVRSQHYIGTRSRKIFHPDRQLLARGAVRQVASRARESICLILFRLPLEAQIRGGSGGDQNGQGLGAATILRTR